MELIVLWIGINALIGYALGKPKNEVGASILICILLGPIGWIFCILNKGKLRECPYCAEQIKPEAKVCRYCGRDVPLAAPAKSKPINLRARTFIWLTIGVLAFVSLLLGLLDHKPDLTKATLTTGIYLQDGSNTYIPGGSNVEVLSHSESTAHIRYAGRDVVVSTSVLAPSK